MNTIQFKIQTKIQIKVHFESQLSPALSTTLYRTSIQHSVTKEKTFWKAQLLINTTRAQRVETHLTFLIMTSRGDWNLTQEEFWWMCGFWFFLVKWNDDNAKGSCTSNSLLQKHQKIKPFISNAALLYDQKHNCSHFGGYLLPSNKGSLV